MPDVPDLWDQPVSGWISLSKLLTVVTRKLGIDAAVAAPVIQRAAAAGLIESEVVGWRFEPLSFGPRGTWVQYPRGSASGMFEPDEPPKVTEAGWRHVDWSAGKLCNCTIHVKWDDVTRALQTLADSTLPEGNGALALAVPDWVALTDVQGWLSRRFGVQADSLMPLLLTALRKGEVRHRVAGLTPSDMLDFRHPRRGGRDFPGLAWSKHPYVQDWDAAGTDWPSGTVSGRRRRSGLSARLSIEVSWLDVELWASSRVDHPRAPTSIDQQPKGQREPAASAGMERIKSWMHGFATAHHLIGRKPKRDDAIKQCRDYAKATYREAQAAWDALPSEWKNWPRTAKS